MVSERHCGTYIAAQQCAAEQVMRAGPNLRTTTTGLSALVMNMSPFQIMRAEKTIKARFKAWLRSCDEAKGEHAG